MMAEYVKLSRPKSWLKNIIVFIPLVFALELFNINQLLATAIVFISFCLVSSAVYVFNDICDAKLDATHEVKRNRPIASGAITKRHAAVFAVLLCIFGLAASFYVSLFACILVIAYIILNIFYSLWLKNVLIFDCFCIAAGFVLRVYTGGAASGEPVSDWLFLTIVSMALFMAFGKRRGELVKGGDAEGRAVLRLYDKDFLQGMVWICAGLAVVFYSLWAINRGNNMIYTVPLIIFIVSKYLLHVSDSNYYGDPTTIIFEDKILLVVLGVYGLLTIALLYFGGLSK